MRFSVPCIVYEAHFTPQLVTIAADITSNLPNNAPLGIVSLSGVPYMSMLFDVASKLSLSYAQAMTNKEDFPGAVKACVEVAQLPFAHPENVPFDIKCAWLGTVLLPSAAVRGHYFTRTQDPAKLIEAGRQGIPICVIYGSEDQVVYPEVALAELRRHFTDNTVTVIEGAGHAVFYDAAEEVVDLVISFAERIEFNVRNIIVFLGALCIY